MMRVCVGGTDDEGVAACEHSGGGGVDVACGHIRMRMQARGAAVTRLERLGSNGSCGAHQRPQQRTARNVTLLRLCRWRFEGDLQLQII